MRIYRFQYYTQILQPPTNIKNHIEKLQKRQKMANFTNFYKNQPINRRISIIFIANVLLVFIIMSISLSIQYLNIANYQNEVPDRFFTSYNRQSLEQIAARAKSYVLSIIDYRMSVFTVIYNNIRNDHTVTLPQSQTKTPQPNTLKLPGILSCEFSQPNSTIFSCSMNSYSGIILQETWDANSYSSVKRMNIIYQNKQDPNDIMAKSISQFPDFEIKNVTEISQKIDSLREGYLRSKPFKIDQYGSDGDRVSTFGTKIDFGRYWVMIQLQVLNSFFRKRRLLYSDDANVVIMKKNQRTPLGYELINNFYPLLPDLDYSKILNHGYAESILPNGKIIYSYTSSYSSQIKIGTANYLEIGQDVRDPFVIIVHSTDVNLELPDKINSFVWGLNKVLKELLGVFFVFFCVVIIMNACYEDSKIGKLFRNIVESIRDYGKNPKNYFNISGEVISLSFQDYITRPILRNLDSVIKVIESKKKKFAEKSRLRNNDQFPLNMFVPTIGQAYVSQDLERLEELRKLIIVRRQSVQK